MFWRNLARVVVLVFGWTGMAQAANVTVGPSGSMTFSPSNVTINAGDSVTFVHAAGLLQHNVTSDTGLFRCANGCDGAGGNGNISSTAWSSTVTFNNAGTFAYYCENHGGPGGFGMAGKVTVNSVAATPDFSIAADAGSLNVTQASSANIGITLTPLNGFSSAVTFAASGLPTGVTAAFAANSATSTTLTLSASAAAAPGSSALTITATSGNLVHTAPLTLNVNAAAAFAITPGITGSWYNSTQSGHGFNLEVLPNNLIAGYWYVFDANGNNLWLTGVGSYTGNTATLTMIQVTGGLFPPNFDPTKIVRTPWGTLTLTFTDCNNGTAAWAPTAAGFAGSASPLGITRLTALNGLTCP